MGRPHRRWQDMTTRDFADPEIARWIAVLPVAAVEQHGPHLPLSVDATINEGILARALDLVDSAVPVTVLPAQVVGKSNEHLGFPGTLSISAETAIRLWTEIAECVARTGVRKLVLLNSHGGQPQIVDIVATDLRVRLGLLAVAANSYALADPADLFPAEELRHGIHAGAIETSMIMALRPDDVRRERLDNFRSLRETMARDFTVLRPGGRVGFAWATQDLNADGACGDARMADADKGRTLLERSARALATLFEEIDRFDMALLRSERS
ncbi:MAG: creatininase family protein [Alphaproteobacteria bacterium]|nr:creatininase family protein [Alphaproteobacteria bacterium]